MQTAIFFHDSSFEAAKALLNDCSDSGNEHICHAYQNGVLIGKLKKIAIQDHQQADNKRHLQRLHPGTDVIIPTLAQCAKHVVRVDCNGSIMKFLQGDVCIIAGGPSLTEEWYLKITNIILAGAFMNKYYIFIDGTYYIPAFNQGRVVKHPWTETVQLVAHQYGRDTVRFASQLKRKCLLYPEAAVKDNPSFYLPIDFDGPPPKAVTVPVYPEEGDNVKVQGRGVWFGRIISSDDENHKANLKWFIESRGPGLYTLSCQEDTVAWRSILGFASMRRVMGGYRLEN